MIAQPSGLASIAPSCIDGSAVRAAYKRSLRTGLYWRLSPEERAILKLSCSFSVIRSPTLARILFRIIARVLPSLAVRAQALALGLKIVEERVRQALSLGVLPGFRVVKGRLARFKGGALPNEHAESVLAGGNVNLQNTQHAQRGLNSSNAGKFERESARKPPREAAEDIVRKLKECAGELEKLLGDELVGFVLFGSWARGEAREDSDVDVLVVLKSLKGMEARAFVYKVVAERVKRAVTLVDARADELFKEGLELTPLLFNILVDGIVVYDKTGRLEELAAKARQLVEEMGLVRYRTSDGKYGWKKRDGKPLVPV